MATWGDVTFTTHGKFEIGEISTIEKIGVCKDPSSSTVQRVLVGKGDQGESFAFLCRASVADWESMRADAKANTKRTVTFDDDFTMSAYISRISGTIHVAESYIWFNCTFEEA